MMSRKRTVVNLWSLVLLCLVALLGIECGSTGDQAADAKNDPVMKLLSERLKYEVQLKSCADKRNQWDEKEGVILSTSVINNSKITLRQLTVDVCRYAPGKEDLPLESRRVTLDVSGIAPKRGSELMLQLDGFLPGPMDLLSVELKPLPDEAEYDQYPELADALAARAAAQKP